MKTSILFQAVVLTLATTSLAAQINLSKIELGGGVSNFIYQGDLTPSKIGSFRTMRWGLDVYGTYKLSNRLGLKTKIIVGGLKGDESRYDAPKYRQQRNFAFRTPVTEISEHLVWNIATPGTDGGRRLTPYISAGIGYAFLRIKRDYSRYNLAYFGPEHYVTIGLGEDTSHNLPRGMLVVPVSAGVRYALNNRWSLNLETSYRLNGNDYLDGFSQSANTTRKDHFFTNTIGVIYTFGKPKGIDCPPAKRSY